MAKPKKQTALPHDETDLKNRALAAYWRSGRPGEKLAAPSADGVAVVKAGGKFYVTLTGADDVLLMCYRVRNDGKLKRMLRIPRELKGEG
jgi:hypothetical protein